MEQRFKNTFAQAQQTAQQRLDEYLKQFKKQDEEKRAALERGDISKDEYQKWRKNKMLRKNQLKSTVDEMAKAYVRADEVTMGYLRGELPRILGVNFDYGASEIFDEVKWSFKLYDQNTISRLIATDPKMLPNPRADKYKDTDWYRKKINSAVTQGILHGDSIPNIAKQLNSVTNSGMAAATRNVRTAVTGAECAGRLESYQMAEADGVEMVQVWQATLDGRTRHSHAAIDGEQIEVGGTFSNGCKYPGDPNGAPEEVYNCRCTIKVMVKKYAKYHERGKYGNGKLGDETYDEWKERHIKALEAKQNGDNIASAINEQRYRTFQDGKDVNDFFHYDSEQRGILAMRNSEYGKWKSSLSQQQRIDIAGYCADQYADINSYWRQYGDWQEINAEKVKAQTKSLDEAIASFNLKSDIKTYRAVQPEAFQEYWDNIQDLVGKEYTDPAFMSTSPFKGSDAVNKDCVMELLIPAGKGRGAYINDLSGFKDKEYEFLLARDSKFKIYSVEETEEKLILKMEMIV